eukprot:2693280-Pyramimonas_sp.AAC.1
MAPPRRQLCEQTRVGGPYCAKLRKAVQSCAKLCKETKPGVTIESRHPRWDRDRIGSSTCYWVSNAAPRASRAPGVCSRC